MELTELTKPVKASSLMPKTQKKKPGRRSTPPKPHTPTRIRWTEEETEIFAQAFVRLRVKNVEWSVALLIERSQHDLPEDRRRTIPGYAGLTDLCKVRIAEISDEYRARFRNWDAKEMESEGRLRQLHEEREQKLTREDVIEGLTLEEVRARFPTEDLVASIPLDALAGLVAQRMVAQMMRDPQPQIPVNLPIGPLRRFTDGEPKPRKREGATVALIGGGADDYRKLVNAIGEHAAIYHEKGQGQHKGKGCHKLPCLDRRDLVVVVTTAVRHDYMHQVKGAVEKDRICYWRGDVAGVKAIRARLLEKVEESRHGA